VFLVGFFDEALLTKATDTTKSDVLVESFSQDEAG
jgi:hypothetical protein